MNEPNVDRVRKYFQDKEIQGRVTKSMLAARSNVTVTISRAAGLFDFSESQLREWEKRGLLKTERPALSEDSKTSKGHRQFSSDELDKLALIKELLDHNFSVSDIPTNVDVIWEQIKEEQQGQVSLVTPNKGLHVHEIKHIPIDKRVERTNEEVFWRYFVSQVLRLSLILLCEDIPDTIAGIIVPLRRQTSLKMKYQAGDQPDVGPSLVGWLEENRSFHSFLDENPSFTFPSDFRIQPLSDVGYEKQHDNALIVIQREAKDLNPNNELVASIQSLLKLLYQHIESWEPFLDYGMRDWEYQITDFSNPKASDEVLNKLADMVVELGGKTPDGRDRWHFALLFLPKDTGLPVQQRNLVVRAQSKCSPHQVGSTIVHRRDPGLSFRAYQSGHVVYRPKIAPQDFILAYRELEESTRSAIAISIAGDDGLPLAVLYIASDEADAFSVADQRVLRLITRMVQELLATYRARHGIAGKYSDLITNPGVVDTSFREFLSEDQFINDLESLLNEIYGQNLTEQQIDDPVSFIAIDIDSQGSLATKYGDRVARNLSREVGLRIRGQLRLISNSLNRRLYHVNSDTYYLLLQGMQLDEARNRAENLRIALGGEYRLDARRIVAGRPMLREGLLMIPGVSVRLGVSSYTTKKLKEILLRFPAETAITNVRSLIIQNIDEQLEIGQRKGGNCIISWDPGIRDWIPWSPLENS